MNNQSIADFAVWLRFLAFFSINVLQVRFTQKMLRSLARQQT